MAQYRELEAFAQFASDLDPATKAQLLKGEKLTQILIQPQYSPLSVAYQVTILYAGNNGFLDNINNSDIPEYKKQWFEYFSSNMPELEAKLNSGDKLSDEDKENLNNQLKNFNEHVFSKE